MGTLAHVKGNAHSRQVIGIGTEVHLTHAAPAGAATDKVANLVRSLARNRRQTEGHLVLTHYVQFIALVVSPSALITREIVEEAAIGYFAILQIVVLAGLGNADVTGIGVTYAVDTNIVVHELGEEGCYVVAQAHLLEVVACVVVVGQNLVDGIDDGVDKRQRTHVLRDIDVHTFLVWVATGLLIGTTTTVVEVGETIKIESCRTTGTGLVDLNEAALAHSGVELPYGNGVRRRALEVVALLGIVDGEFVLWNAHGQQVVGHELIQGIVDVLIVGVVDGSGTEVVVADIGAYIVYRDVGHVLT